MKPHPIPITRHKLARLFAWAQLWLACVLDRCGWLYALGERLPRRELDAMARAAHHLVSLKAAARMPRLARSRDRHGRLKRVTLRTIMGARFRHLTRGRTWAARVFAILAFVRDADLHAARLLKRMKRGLTRLRVILPRAEACALPAFFASEPCAADSS